MKVWIMTLLALLAFAGNSVLCRMALKTQVIDVVSFTAFRLLAGAITLSALVVLFQAKNHQIKWLPAKRHGWGALWLLLYAIGFSLAYVQLDTGSGALILFGSVQLTMFLAAWLQGRRPRWMEVMGLIMAFAGLVVLSQPAWGTPTWTGMLLMLGSGVAWGLYTLGGKGAQQPLLDTCKNFILTTPWVLMLMAVYSSSLDWNNNGLLLAIASGALTSGLGYAIWYAVLPHLTVLLAGVVQLLVPVLAAVGGLWWLGEPLGMRWLIAAAMILGGIYAVLHTNRRPQT